MRRITPWAVLFAVIAVWHWWRGADADAVIFSAATALLLIESLRPTALGTAHRTVVRSRVVVVVGCALTVLLTALPRYSAITAVIVVMCGAGGFRMVWYHLHQRYHAALDTQQRTAIHLWVAATVLLLLVEFSAYLGAVASGSDSDYPTITVLLDPAIDHWWGRTLFSALWLVGGWALVSTRPAGKLR